MHKIRHISFFQHIDLKKTGNHVLCWSLFITYELSIFYYSTGALDSIFKYFFYYTCNICLFYSQAALLESSFKRTKPNYSRFLLLLSIEMAAFLFIKMTGDYFLTGASGTFGSKIRYILTLWALNLYRQVYFIALSTIIWSSGHISRLWKTAASAEIKRLTLSRDKAVLETELAKVQNAYLKQQINPHLLFNSLNFIHSHVHQYSEKAGEIVVLLADIIRFSLEETDTEGKVALIKETEQLHNLITINRYRFDYPPSVSITLEGDFSGHRIIPLVLMTLTENFFKHADLRHQPAFIALRVSESGYLSFHSSNYKRPKPPQPRLQSTGIENIKTRLEFAYRNKYQLVITETADIYESILTLQL